MRIYILWNTKTENFNNIVVGDLPLRLRVNLAVLLVGFGADVVALVEAT